MSLRHLAGPVIMHLGKMRNAYIVKKSIKRSPLKPKEEIKYEEFKSLVENSVKLIWLEKTKHGKRWHEANPKSKKEIVAYLNIDENDEKSFVQLSHTKSGYIGIQFDFKSTKENLHDLIDLAEQIDCNLWQYSPKRQILTHELVNNRHKRTKPRAKNQSTLKAPTNWIYCEGSIENFQLYNRIKFDRIKSTVARINNGTSKNSILGIEIENDTFYIIGEGLNNLFDTEIKHKEGDNFESQKSRFEKRMSKLFDNVVFKDSISAEQNIKIESEIMNRLDVLIKNKEEIYIAKILKKLF